MKGEALVSVVIPAFRAADFIAAALGSVGLQTWRPLELVVVDDASDDDTVPVVEEFVARAPDGLAIRLVRHETNRGAAAALDTGIAASQGELVCWLSADDAYLDPRKIEGQVAALAPGVGAVFDRRFLQGSQPERAEEVVTGWATLRSSAATLDLTPPRLLLGLIFQNPINGSSILMRREALDHVGGFDPELKNVDADADLWMRLAAAGWRLVGRDAAGIFYRVHPGQTSADRPTMLRGMALSRTRMILALEESGRLDEVVASGPDLLAGAALHRLHRAVPVPVQALIRGVGTRASLPWLRLMELDLRRKKMWDSVEADQLIRDAHQLLSRQPITLTVA